MTVGIAMLVLGLVGLPILFDAVDSSHEETAEQLLGTVAESVSASYNAFDPKHGQHPIGEIALQLAAREELAMLDVFDHRGIIQRSIDPKRTGQIIPPEILRAVMSRTSSVASGTLSNEVAHPRIVRAIRKHASCLPCHANSPDPIGGVHIAGSRAHLFGSVTTLTTQAILLTWLFGFLITGLMLVLITRAVITPLGKLASVMDQAEEGDFFVRAEVKSNDEIGVLASTFNKLLAKITDLRVEGIEAGRELSDVRDELSLAAALSEKSTELEVSKDRLQERLNQLSFLYDLGRELASQLDVDALLEHFSELVHTKLRVPQFAILLVDEKQDSLEVIAARGFEKDAVAVGPFRVEQSITGEAIRSRAPVYVPDVASDGRRVLYREDPETRGTLLSVPVTYRNKLIGILNFSSAEVRAFDPDEQELSIAVGNQAALAFANARLFRETVELSMADGLTGIANRRALEERLDLEWSKAARYKDPLSLVMVDIDCFKNYNDQQGHQLGDETLRRVARILETNIRKVDAVGRYGGEEFVVVLPRVGEDEAVKIADKLRRSVEQADFERGFMQPLGRVTISCGVATTLGEGPTLEALIGMADEALFTAKREGRNAVRAAPRAPIDKPS